MSEQSWCMTGNYGKADLTADLRQTHRWLWSAGLAAGQPLCCNGHSHAGAEHRLEQRGKGSRRGVDSQSAVWQTEKEKV